MRNQDRRFTHVMVVHPELDPMDPKRVQLLRVRKGQVHHVHTAYMWAVVKEVKGLREDRPKVQQTAKPTLSTLKVSGTYQGSSYK